MKKTLLFILLCALCVSLFGCGKAPADKAPAGTNAETADDERIRLPDFTVETVNGDTFSLSEALAENRTVLINLWATWCGYCTLEFPYLQEAWEQNRDTASVICLSIEPQDTPEAIRAYAAENGFSLPMGSAVGTGLESYADEGVPVTIAVSPAGYVTAVHLGALRSAGDFIALMENSAQTAETCAYTVNFLDETGNLLPGCAVSFCAGETCVPVFANDEGTAVFEGAPQTYTVKLLSAPEGYRAADTDEQTAGPYTQTIFFYLQKETP